MFLAGSAIAQNAGLISTLETWMPKRIISLEPGLNPKWLLLAGANNPPKDVSISDRRTRGAVGDKNGTFLGGVTKDLANMEDAIGSKLYNTIKDLYMTKGDALNHISKFFKHCQAGRFKPMMYYTGHGQVGTGNWCFNDGTISVDEILGLIPNGPGWSYPTFFCDTCYSGNWANLCLTKLLPDLHCLSACPEYTTAIDNPGMCKT